MPVASFADVTLDVDGTRYLDGASLSVGAGERLLVVGLPGSGLSFVPRLLLGLPGLVADRAQVTGRVCVDGQDLAELTPQELQMLRCRIGSVMRDGGLIENMVIGANVMLPLTYHHRDTLGAEQIQARCSLLLRELQVEYLDQPGRRPVSLNRLERITVALARALIVEPFLLMADDPCAGLSPEPARALCDQVFGYDPAFPHPLPGSRHPEQRRTRLVTASCLMPYLPHVDRVVLLMDGKLESLGEPDSVAADPRTQMLLHRQPASEPALQGAS